MGRHKLIDYLNDPTLLHSISVEEMQAWAQEVPYAGLVQRLLAQKLALEGSEGLFADKANTMAIISNANPDHTIKTIEDFKQMVLASEAETKTEVSPPKEEDKTAIEASMIGHSITDQDKELVDMAIEKDASSSDIVGSDDSIVGSDEANVESDNLENEDVFESINESPNSDFSEWLLSLKSLDKVDEEDGSIQLKEKELASSALAELLVSQGHHSRAI